MDIKKCKIINTTEYYLKQGFKPDKTGFIGAFKVTKTNP